MAKDKNSYAVSLMINVHRSSLTKKEVEKLAKGLVGQLHTSLDAELASGVTGDSSLNVAMVDPPIAPSSKTMTWEDLEESIGGQMDKLAGPAEIFDPIAIRMADGNPVTGVRVMRGPKGWEAWLSDAERL
jgi:hypothetical protein